ncbi:MAG: M23 family metallopeptidase [Nitrospinae bacterium]|nr:M23 family metallopeptidase [Nitrospinota bacterium]
MKSKLKNILKKDITLMVFSDYSNTPKKFFLSRKLIVTGMVSVFLFITGISALSYHFYTENIQLKDISTAINESKTLTRDEMERQKKEIKVIANNIKAFSEDLNELKDFDKKIRIITALGGQNDSFFGKGGPEDRDFINMDELIERNDTGKALEYLSEDMQELRKVSSVQKNSFIEIDKYLRKQTSILASTPSIWPVKGWITSDFGYRISPFTGLRKMHEGIDVVAKLGTPVIAPASGVVTKSREEGGYGLVVEIKHGYGLVTRFGHNSKLLVKAGDKIRRGQVISKVGSTGRSTGSHLHYEVLLNGVPVNPMNYIIN